MISKTTRRFRETYGRLPEHVQRRAREAYRRFKDNPTHPSLRFKQVHATQPIYSARVGLGYRASSGAGSVPMPNSTNSSERCEPSRRTTACSRRPAAAVVRCLTYTSAALDRDLTIIGDVRCVLHGMSSAPDTEWVVRFDRNLNTGGAVGAEARGQAALNTVFHDAMRPSRIVLPVVE